MSDAAIANLITGLVTVTTLVVGFLTIWVKLKYGAEQAEQASKKADVVEKKIDDNTAITRAGTAAATVNARAAAASAAESKVVTQQMSQSLERKLNGGIDSAVSQAVDPMKKVLDDHTTKIEQLNKYVHDRNHEVMNALQVMGNKLELILKKIEGSS